MQRNSNEGKNDIRARSYAFSLNIIALCDKLPQKRSAWVIADQLVRSATSIGANLVEARGSSSRLEYKRYYEISLKSAHETEYWLSLLRDAHLVKPDEVETALSEVNEFIKMLSAGVLKLKSKSAA